MLYRTALAIATSAMAAATLPAQPTVLLGDSAAVRFVYRGAPINPACLARLSSSAGPIPLSSCVDDSGGDYSIRNFQVLANRGSDFLVTSSIRWRNATTGTNGVAWIRLADERLAYVRDTGLESREPGISVFMCGGAGAHVDGQSVRISKAGSTPAVLKLAGVYIDSATALRLRDRIRPSEAANCDQAEFTYDLSADRMTFDGVRLGGRGLEMLDTAGARTPGANPQGCFDVLAWEVRQAGPDTLSPAALADLGRRFAGRCLSPRPGEPSVAWAPLDTPPERGLPEAAWVSARANNDGNHDHGALSSLVSGKSLLCASRGRIPVSFTATR